ncbi:hypothetical protein KHQ06_33170 [Nocardia tengchongensis]|uniref:Uncharacterized protein n=1 Tax=Nocardia tengchongensis TaxID=2055889 RepID=A0ABX8CNF3_9NOCA|nr:hypothetical protein [Nocardia tengchongensis]QVI20881.1 hypothetical protein KHQ06_33170 [Nocardia tengchongensis]
MSTQRSRMDSAAQPLKRAAAAARLGIAVADLPELGAGWTVGEVWRLRRERPDWLIEARRRFPGRGPRGRVRTRADSIGPAGGR